MTIPKLRFRRDTTGGFTLVELLVVIAIIGVLATLVLLQLGTARARARDTKRITDVNQMRTAVEQYYEDNNGTYPTSIDCAGGKLATYLTKCPKDPLSAVDYGYGTKTVAGKITGYQIYARLEQNAAALNGAAGMNATTAGWATGIDASGAAAACKAAPSTTTCIYDQGINQ